MSFDAFISYSAHDKAVADAACAVLERRGIRCWIAPRDLLPGMDWGEGIIDAINGSRVMVLVYSANANASPQIKREVERAVHRGIPIIPFRIEDVPMSKALEYFISSPHWLDALTPPLEQHLEYLAKTVAVILTPIGTDPPPPPPPPPPPVPVPVRPAFPTAYRWLAAAAVVIAGAWFALRMSHGPVNRSLVGQWTLTTTDKTGQWLSTFTISADGHYRMSVLGHDSGVVVAVNGQYQMRSTTQTVSQGTYTPISPTSVAITSALGTVNWTLRPGSAQGTGALSGIWDANPTISGAPWHQTITYGDGGAYSLVSTTGDSGTMSAAAGAWTMTSSTGPPTNGTYQVTGSQTLVFIGPPGPATWTRR